MDKKYKKIVKCMNCGKAMVYYNTPNKLICSSYHKNCKCERFTISEYDLNELLEFNEVQIDEIDKIYINSDHYYKIFCKDGKIKSYDGHTFIIN